MDELDLLYTSVGNRKTNKQRKNIIQDKFQFFYTFNQFTTLVKDLGVFLELIVAETTI